MDFLEKLKALLSGTSSTGTPPQGRTAPNEPQGNPWDVPINGGPQMPTPAAPTPVAAAPTSSIEDAVAQAVALQKQREKVKMLAPDWLNAQQ